MELIKICGLHGLMITLDGEGQGELLVRSERLRARCLHCRAIPSDQSIQNKGQRAQSQELYGCRRGRGGGDLF